MNIIIGNIIAFIASLVMVYCGLLKSKKKMIVTQIFQNILFSISDFILGGFSGTVVNLVSIFRNILGYYDKLNFINQIIIIGIIVILSFIFNDMGFLGLLPVISIIVITICMKNKDPKVLKISFIISSILWLIYDFLISSYTSCFFDFLCIIANCYALYKMYRVQEGL